MDIEPISKEDKRKISRMDQIDSVSHMVYLVSNNNTQGLGAFSPELILAICWEETYWQNIPQYGGGPAVGYGQLEHGGRVKAHQHDTGNYKDFSGSEGRFTGPAILSSAELSIQAVSHCLAGLYTQLGYTQQAALYAYAGAAYRPENATCPKRWTDCANALKGLSSDTGSMSPLAVEDALRKSRTFDTTGSVYEYIHTRLWPLEDVLGLITGTLQEPAQGPEVAYLQDALNRVPSNDPWSSAASLPLNLDGFFGPKTTSRVRRFQSSNGIDANGVVGPQTLGAMFQHIFANV